MLQLHFENMVAYYNIFGAQCVCSLLFLKLDLVGEQIASSSFTGSTYCGDSLSSLSSINSTTVTTRC